MFSMYAIVRAGAHETSNIAPYLDSTRRLITVPRASTRTRSLWPLLTTSSRPSGDHARLVTPRASSRKRGCLALKTNASDWSGPVVNATALLFGDQTGLSRWMLVGVRG